MFRRIRPAVEKLQDTIIVLIRRLPLPINYSGDHRRFAVAVEECGVFKMVAITISEILAHVEDFERMLAAYYANLSEQTDQTAVCLVTDYISRHRYRTIEALSKLPPAQLRHTRDVRLRYRPHLPGPECFDEIQISPEASVEEVCRAAVRFNQYLIRMYRQIARQPIERHIRELFENLIRLEEKDELTMKKIQAFYG